jgi:hypothetical protein
LQVWRAAGAARRVNQDCRTPRATTIAMTENRRFGMIVYTHAADGYIAAPNT